MYFKCSCLKVPILIDSVAPGSTLLPDSICVPWRRWGIDPTRLHLVQGVHIWVNRGLVLTSAVVSTGLDHFLTRSVRKSVLTEMSFARLPCTGRPTTLFSGFREFLLNKLVLLCFLPC